jgi:hypothetical protein
MNWDAFWNAWMALATTALVAVTISLAVVGFLAARWAKRTFTQTERIEQKKRAPLVSLMLMEPGDPQAYLRYAREGQFQTHWKWWEVARRTGTAGLIRYQSIVACWAYNIGEGAALKVVVPYRLRVSDFTSDGSESETECPEGEFEIVHVLPGNWAGSRTYLNVTYYPKWAVELLVDKLRVVGVDNRDVQGSVAATTEERKEGNNHAVWELMRNLPQPPAPKPPPAPPWLAGGGEDQEASPQ